MIGERLLCSVTLYRTQTGNLPYLLELGYTNGETTKITEGDIEKMYWQYYNQCVMNFQNS